MTDMGIATTTRTQPLAAPVRTASMYTTAMEVATRLLRKYLRSPQLLVMSLASGTIFVVLFRYIFGGAIDFGRVPYVDFLIPGMVMTSVLIAAPGTAVGVAEDGEHGFYDRLRSLPVPHIALLSGRALGESVIVAWSVAITAAIGFAVGFRLHGSVAEALAAYALCVVCGFAFIWMFICVGLVAGNAQSAQGISTVAYPLIFISSAYVPVGTMPGWMRVMAEHQPVTVMCNAVRSLALGDPALAGLAHTTTYWVTLSLLWSAGIVALFAPLAIALYRRGT
ncbi:ABC transporter permease [Spirillospora sp. CA-294931]|uniref:ABC transporter permease n=1 Tax=Spirillospora sp. CA-294931 TaxID=3240042 RepID=UPI003D8B9530